MSADRLGRMFLGLRSEAKDQYASARGGISPKGKATSLMLLAAGCVGACVSLTIPPSRETTVNETVKPVYEPTKITTVEAIHRLPTCQKDRVYEVSPSQGKSYKICYDTANMVYKVNGQSLTPGIVDEHGNFIINEGASRRLRLKELILSRKNPPKGPPKEQDLSFVGLVDAIIGKK